MASLCLALLLAVFVMPNAVATASAFGMEPRLWQHELKKTYCQMIEKQRIYKLEQLDVYCAGKVGFFDDEMVSNYIVVIAAIVNAVFKVFFKVEPMVLRMKSVLKSPSLVLRPCLTS